MTNNEKFIKIIKDNYNYDVIIDNDGALNVEGIRISIPDWFEDSDIEDYASYIYALIIEDSNNITDESVTNVSSTGINTVAESLDKNKSTLNDGSVSLLVALDSEKDAVVIYEELIKDEKEHENNEEVVDLLQTILSDEKEHIALLSALCAKINKDYVDGSHTEEDFNDYISETIEED